MYRSQPVGGDLDDRNFPVARAPSKSNSAVGGDVYSKLVEGESSAEAAEPHGEENLAEAEHAEPDEDKMRAEDGRRVGAAASVEDMGRVEGGEPAESELTQDEESAGRGTSAVEQHSVA